MYVLFTDMSKLLLCLSRVVYIRHIRNVCCLFSKKVDVSVAEKGIGCVALCGQLL